MVATKKRTIVVTSARMMGWLVYNGNKLLNMREDLKDSTRFIYIFEKTDKLYEDMGRYSK